MIPTFNQKKTTFKPFYYLLLLYQLVLVSTMKDKQGKPMPNATPSVPDGSELDVSLYQAEGKLN